MNKIKQFFIKLTPSKRKIIQLYSALLYNAHMKGFITGEIFEGKSKSVCLPGLNCYSCPGAVGACPLGSIQNALSESKTKLPTYVFGIILLYCIILGRTICGFLCPVGLLQELLYKIKTPKVRKSNITRCLSYFKYVLLFVLVIGLPLIYGLQAKGIPLPGFCKYICPAGTFEGAIFLLMNKANTSFYDMLGVLFTWKFTLLMIFIVSAVFIYRVFCRFFCPLGAIYGLFNKLSILGVKVEKSKCNHCNACINTCKMDVKEVGDHECIQCGDCMKVCGCKAIKWKMISEIIKDDEEKTSQNDSLVITEEVKSKKVFKISKKNFNIITYTLMIVTLTTCVVLANIGGNTYETFDIVDNIKLTLNENTIFDIKSDSNTTLMYFYNDENLDIETFKNYSNEKLNIILVNPNGFSNLEQELLKQYNIYLYTDNSNKLLRTFDKKCSYPYSVYLDFNDKILINENMMITNEKYFDTIVPTLLGLSIGNKVGDICINKEINLVGRNDIFSISKNRGKVTVINFWYTTCTPCVQELPHFNEVYLEYKDYVDIIAIHEATGFKNNPDNVKNFINTNFEGFSIKFGYDDPNDSYYKKLGGLQAWPFTIIINGEGVITNITHGSMTKDELIYQIERSINNNE